MNQPAHKTEGVNRTKRVWFYPFVFTGKEKDEETGYSYFGARYMDHELMTSWLSVDPMADKYPSLSPYVYCAWNPVKLVDPDGREIKFDPTTGKKYIQPYEAEVDARIARIETERERTGLRNLYNDQYQEYIELNHSALSLQSGLVHLTYAFVG